MPRDPSKRAHVLEFICSFLQEKGHAPTIKEIQMGCGYASPRPVQYHLKVLAEQGLIEHTHGMARGIGIPGAKRSIDVPLLGTIAAGEPIPAPPSSGWSIVPEAYIQVPPDILRGSQNAYALRVKGTSMIDALVDDGDIVILEKASAADDGQMVAVWLRDRDKATLKRLYCEPGRIRLQPANRTMKPIYVDPDEVEVQGRVIAVLRKL